MPRPAAEIIREHQVEEARRATAELAAARAKANAERKERERLAREASAARRKATLDKIYKLIFEHKKEQSPLQEAADRVLNESGILEEIKGLQKTTKGRNSLFVNCYYGGRYGAGKAELTFAWGTGFEVEKQRGGFKKIKENKECDYQRMAVSIDVNSESLNIEGISLDKQEWQTDRQRVNDAVAKAFLNARRVVRTYTPPTYDYGTYDGPGPGSGGGGTGGMGGAG